jgi:hypothetical protein
MVANEDRVAARAIELGTELTFAVLVATFALYLGGVFQPLVPFAELVRLWSLPAEEYVRATGAPTGWSWLAQLGRGDYLNLLGLALFPLVATAAYATLAAAFLRERSRSQALLALLQVMVLVFAAF